MKFPVLVIFPFLISLQVVHFACTLPSSIAFSSSKNFPSKIFGIFLGFLLVCTLSGSQTRTEKCWHYHFISIVCINHNVAFKRRLLENNIYLGLPGSESNWSFSLFAARVVIFAAFISIALINLLNWFTFHVHRWNSFNMWQLKRCVRNANEFSVEYGPHCVDKPFTAARIVKHQAIRMGRS